MLYGRAGVNLGNLLHLITQLWIKILQLWIIVMIINLFFILANCS